MTARSERLLVVDDDADLRQALHLVLSAAGYQVAAVGTAAEAARAGSAGRFDLVLLDLELPDRPGLEVLQDLQRDGIPAIVLSGHANMASTIRAMRDGAFDYMTKPVDPEDLVRRIARALRAQPAKPVSGSPPPLDPGEETELVGRSGAMREVFKHLGLLSASRATVLIRGESGTGKELAARTLHRFSRGTSSEPFVAVSCAALPAPLVEAEIFGYRRGAFTGAEKDHPGKLDASGSGTLFLDEVGEVPLETQVKLLRVLQERCYERLGETTSRPFNARVITATHRNLEDLVRDGRFREDLYYRLNVATVTLPPLRERKDDLALIADRLLVQVAREIGRAPIRLSGSALRLLADHSWPGNVRELRNVLTRAALKCRGGVLREEDVELGSGENRIPERFAPTSARLPTLDEAERDLVRRALAETHGHRAKACALLGISRPTLLRKIRRYGLADTDS